MSDARRGTAPRTDIQGLRAIAVGSVLVYHVAPGSLTGGFVGVDVFFVISGFLITSHLISRTPKTVGDFLGFWGRRIRRLLPASLLVLLFTIVATRLMGPETLWENTARQSGAAALYVVNWLLAADAVDYLAAENAATGVQHYWSLAVEEQFYLFWPLLIAALAWLAARTRLRQAWVWGAGLALVTALSFAWSVHLTGADPGAAYFVTPTRIWELAVGGLAAVGFASLPRALDTGGAAVCRAALGWVGLALIGFAVFRYDGNTPFPSWTAAVPVVGTALVIAVHGNNRWWSPGGLLALRPAQWLGDISYSVYLWHWPLVVLVGARYGSIGWLDGSAIVLASLLLAVLTKRYVEDRFRTASWNVRLGATYRLGAVGMVVVLVAAGGQYWEVQKRQDVAEAEIRQVLASQNPCLGAGSLDPKNSCPTWNGPVVPTPAQAALDKSDAYPEISGGRNCWSAEPDYPQVQCTFGRRRSTVQVTLLGNSHAGQWLPALQPLAAERNWRITTRLASKCASADLLLQFSTDARADACRAWSQDAVAATIKADPDLVVMTNRISLPVPGEDRLGSVPQYEQGYRRVLEQFAQSGIKVLVLHDTPASGDAGQVNSVPDCLASHGVGTRACDGRRDAWLTPQPDPAATAARELAVPGIRSADLNDRICDGETCRAVQGGVIVYFDGSHLTASFAHTLASALGEELNRTGLMPARGSRG